MSLLTVHLQEIHIIHRFENDFYGEPLRAVTLGYIRPEYDFKSLGKILWKQRTTLDLTSCNCLIFHDV